MNEETRQTQDKETNTECVFIPEQGKQRKLSAAGVAPGAIHDDKNSIVIKRSQTFSPSAVVSRNHYICRVSFNQIFFTFIGVSDFSVQNSVQQVGEIQEF